MLKSASPLLDRCEVLRELLTTRTAIDESGEPAKVHSQISAAHAEALYRTVLKLRPTTIVEIGLACGVSALAMLTALDELGGDRRLISIDPNQASQWKGVGRRCIARAGLSNRHSLIEQPDFLALPKLVELQTEIQFAYIDGWHTFDYALLDFFYLDKLLASGGIVAFNDSGWPAVHKVQEFLLSHRKYREIDVGLSRRTPFRRNLRAQFRRAFSRSLQSQDRYFEKLATWEPGWDFFADF
jgi:predicted O-methyltransferase YrrM